MKRFLLIAIVIMQVLKGSAQKYSFVNYTTHNGLVQSSITDIKQDNNGNIWIATTGGLSKFDGKKFTNYDDRQILQSLQVNSLLCDSSGTMWIATGNGLLSYTDSFKTVFQPSKTMQNRTISLTCFPSKNILFVCNNTIYEIQHDRSIKPYIIDHKVEKVAELITYDASGTLWVVSGDGGIFKINGSTAKEYKKPRIVTADYKNIFRFIRAIGNAGAQPFFVATIGTLMVSGDSLNFISHSYPAFNSPLTGAASFVMKDNDSTMWFGANKGLVKLIGKDSAVRFNKQNGFGDHSVSVIMRDREQNLWIGSTYNGVYKLSNEALFTITPPDSIDLKFIKAVMPINEKQTLLGTWGNGFHLLSGDSVKPLHYKLPLHLETWMGAFRYITRFMRVGKTTYIGSLGAGLFKIDDGSSMATEVPLFNMPRQIFQIEPYHNRYILQTVDGGTYLLNKDFKIIRAATEDLNVLEVANDFIFQYSMSGTVNLIDTSFKIIRKNVFPGLVTDISQIVPFGNLLLVATQGDGILVYDHDLNLKQRIDKHSGLNTNAITALLIDGQNLYAGTNFGLVLISLDNFRVKRIFNENEGMFNWECRIKGIVKISNRVIMIATTNGPYFYYPSRDNTEKLAQGYLSVTLSTSGDDNKKRTVLASGSGNTVITDKISYSQNQLVIELKGVSQRAPENVVYHYRLNGFENGWHITADNIPLEYHNLSPGNFVFESFVTVNSFTSPAVTISFTIKKPLQSEWWFQAIVLLLVALFIFWFLNFLNKLYQKYIQAKMIDELGRNMQRKKIFMQEALHSTAIHITESETSFRNITPLTGIKNLEYSYLHAGIKRMQLLVAGDMLSLKDFHDYFDHLFHSNNLHEKLIYQEISDGTRQVTSEKAFILMDIFTLYIVLKLSQNEQFLFSLNSEVRSNNRLVVRSYTLNNLPVNNTSSFDAPFRNALQDLKKKGWSLELIENPETGSMLIVELEL